jgi:hypothetical protein
MATQWKQTTPTVAMRYLDDTDQVVIDGLRKAGEVDFALLVDIPAGTPILPEDVIPMPQQIAETLLQIDTDVDKIYAALLGNREPEYVLAEKEALEFQAAGYTGTVPPSVQAWATAKSQTATWAADDILLAAATWRKAQVAIRATRLLCKEGARNAVDTATLSTVKTQWANFLAAIKPQLGL